MSYFDLTELTGAQLRAARALVGVSGEELAKRTCLALSTIRRAEGKEGPVNLTRANARAIVVALESLGVEFLGGDPKHGSGVRLAKSAAANSGADEVRSQSNSA
jgi:transcriptional regulator with XRE-family HTH domain